MTRGLAIALVAGTVLFWLGAFYLPLGRAWAAPTLELHLAEVAAHRRAWPITIGLMGAGGALWMVATAAALWSASGRWAEVGAVAATVAAALWILVTIARLTWTAAAADHLAAGAAAPWYPPLHAFHAGMFAGFQVLAYLAVAALGATLPLPRWLARSLVGFGLAGALGYPAGVPLFEPPLTIGLAPLVLGMWRLRN